jgi:hypothetical protein
MYIYICIYIHTHIYVYICVQSACASMYVCMYVYIYIYIYVQHLYFWHVFDFFLRLAVVHGNVGIAGKECECILDACVLHVHVELVHMHVSE